MEYSPYQQIFRIRRGRRDRDREQFVVRQRDPYSPAVVWSATDSSFLSLLSTVMERAHPGDRIDMDIKL